MDYYFAFSPTACRKDPKRRFELLSLKSRDENSPLLPLPEVVASATNHPLCSLINGSDDTSEFMANLMGPGPWTFQMCLTVPSACQRLHFSNKNRRAPIEVSHTLKIVVRAQRGDDQHVDPESGKPKQFDIVMRVPVHILSVRRFFLPLENLFVLTRTVRLCFLSLCQTPITSHSRATPRALMHHPHHFHQQHRAPPSRTMDALYSVQTVPLYRNSSNSRLLQVCLSHYLKSGLHPKWTSFTNVT